MIDIIEMQNTFYIKWALRLLAQKDERWTVIPRKMLKCVGGEKVFLSNVELKQFKGLDEVKSIFWKEVLKVWLGNLGAENILNLADHRGNVSPLCNNKNIRYGNETLFLPEAMKRGIISIEDVFENRELISYETFLYRFGGYNRAALDYTIIVNAMRQQDIILTANINELYTVKAKELLFLKNKALRKIVIVRENIKPMTGRLFWKRKFEEDVLERYTFTVNSTKEIKLRELNFKIFHNIVTTNIMLEKMKVKENNKCDHCNEVDFTEHALVSCERIKGFWENVIGWVEKEIDVKIPQDSIICLLFGLVKSDASNCARWRIEKVNHVLLIAKFSIIKSRFMEGVSIESLFEKEIQKRMKYLKSKG